MTDSSATENAFLGALVGAAIGDALGLPLIGMSAGDIASRYGSVDGYVATTDTPDGQPLSGGISDRTEIVLCIVESMTTNNGYLDPANVNARLQFLIAGAGNRHIDPSTIAGIREADRHDGLVPEGYDPGADRSVLVRGIPVGLMHAIGVPDDDAMVADATSAARLSHGDVHSAALVDAAARAVSIVARNVERDMDWSRLIVPTGIDDDLDAALEAVAGAETFEDAVVPVVNRGGETTTFGTFTGAIAGARFGASGLPQSLIDDLDARIYLSMAAPWFYRTAVRRGGSVIDLRDVTGLA